MEYEDLLDTLRETHMDFEHYCFLRDRNKHILDEYEVFSCQNCKKIKHTKFTCPKLHFVPIRQHVINKAQRSEAVCKNARIEDEERI
jgi:hypothetical protein